MSISDRNENIIVYCSLFLGFTVGVLVIFSTINSYGGGDHFTHYSLAHWGWKYPNLLFNHWGKPLFTILISPFAQFGINGTRIYNLFIGILTAILIWRLALLLHIKNSPFSLLLVLFSPIYFILMFTSLTEITFSFFLTLSVYLFFRNRYILSAVILSFIPLVRTEGVILFPLFIFAYSSRKAFLAIPFLISGFIIFSLLGSAFYSNIWWLLTKMPYTGNRAEVYGSGPLLHFVFHIREILGYPITALFLMGLVILIHKWINKEKFSLSTTFYFLLLIPGSFLVFFVAHSFVWWQGLGNSLGLLRVIGSVTPFAALTSLIGFNYFAELFERSKKWKYNLFRYSLFIAIISISIHTYFKDFSPSPIQQLTTLTANYLSENNLLANNKIYYYDRHLLYLLDIDPNDKTKSQYGIPNMINPSSTINDSSIIVWDAHFGPNNGRYPMTIEKLKQVEDFKILKVFRPKNRFKVLGGHDFAIYVFQKRHIIKRVDEF